MHRTIPASVAMLAGLLLAPQAQSQTGNDASCGQKLEAQLRRFNEQCVKDLVSFVASSPKGQGRIASEKDKFYVRVSRTDTGLEGETASRQNLPFLKPETETALKALGWTPPDVEFGGFKRAFSAEEVRSGDAAAEVVKALQALGLTQGEATAVSAGETE